MATEMATLGGGCFWCTEALFLQLKGVLSVESGYAGGTTSDPSYEQVCSGTTGHAEVIRLTFEPEVLDYRDILNVFFTIHDPTTPNQQGNDIGTQYRSIIFYHSPQQEETARQVMAEMAHVWDAPIVTERVPLENYYKAEDVHQDFFHQHPEQGYCAIMIAPKVAKLRDLFADKVKD